MTDKSGQGFPGQQGLTDNLSQYNQQRFLIWSALARVRTVVIVQVKAVDVAAMTVDVQPLVNQMDGVGGSFPHGTIYGLPYVQMQGGTSGIKNPPKVDDVGPALICDRDISSVKANKAPSTPGSRRRFSLADGIYLGGVLNDAPEQYIEFGDGKVTTKSDLIEADGNSKTTGDARVDGDISGGGDIAATGGLSGASVSIPGSSTGNAGNPILTAAGGVNLTAGFTTNIPVIPPPTNGSTITPNPIDGEKQLVVNNVAGFNIQATSQNGDMELVIVNGASAGTPTFVGFSKQWSGDPLDTVAGHEFAVFIFGYGSKAAYLIKALQ